MPKKTPQGVIAVLVNKDGRPIANTTDFNLGSPGGFTQEEAQGIRARDSLAIKAVRELSSPIMADAINQYVADQILRLMCQNGCRVETISIGYEG